MSLEKLQKIATTPVNDKYKGKWLKWWNSTPMPCGSLRFLQPNFRDIDWFVNASFLGTYNINDFTLWNQYAIVLILFSLVLHVFSHGVLNIPIGRGYHWGVWWHYTWVRWGQVGECSQTYRFCGTLVMSPWAKAFNPFLHEGEGRHLLQNPQFYWIIMEGNQLWDVWSTSVFHVMNFSLNYIHIESSWLTTRICLVL